MNKVFVIRLIRALTHFESSNSSFIIKKGEEIYKLAMRTIR